MSYSQWHFTYPYRCNPPFLFKIRFNIILPCRPKSLSFKFPFKPPHAFLLSAIRVTCTNQLILLDLIPEYLVRNTNYEAPRYALFSSLFQVQVRSWTPHYWTTSAYVLPLMGETRFHTHTKHIICSYTANSSDWIFKYGHCKRRTVLAVTPETSLFYFLSPPPAVWLPRQYSSKFGNV